MALSKQQQQQVMLVAMVVGGFGYVYWNYMLMPTNKKIAELTAKVNDVLGQVETMKRTANRLPALQREYDSLVTEVGETEKRLPKQRNLEEVLRIVTEHATKSKVTVTTFSPGSDKPQNYFVEFPISLSVQGSFHTLGKFMAVLGQQERILASRNIALSYAPNPKKGHTVTGSFQLMAFTFKG
jgi:type IV pilus assembly protein PilO